MTSRDKILEFMRKKAYNPMLDVELANIFKIEHHEIGAFYALLDDMEQKGQIIKTRKNRYAAPERMNLVVGKLQQHSRGFGFILSEREGVPDVFVSSSDMNGAMHNDLVIGRILQKSGYNQKAEAEIIRILERANKEIVGTFESSKNFGFVIPDDQRIHMDIYIPKGELHGAQDGYKVVAQITKWPEARRNPEGKIIEILGHKDDVGTDILSIIRKYKLPEKFPKKVEEVADKIPETISEEEVRRRKDLRNERVITIDGADAKDLDDAVSIKKLSNGNYLLWVHIADVTYYVKERSPLDKEALKRGTSIYLVDRVIPMLPKKLSNGVCSLNPEEDRLALSVQMEINEQGKVLNHEIFESIIRSSQRMTYTDVSDILENDDEILKNQYKDLLEDLKQMENLARILKKEREKRGSIDFDFEEAEIVLDENGVPVQIKTAERRIANQIIEEFMLICNETIAEHFNWLNIPFVYRIHEDPDIEKMEAFNKFIYNFGYYLKGISNEIHPRVLQDLLKKVEGKKEERIVNTLMLRSLKKARYSPDNEGHFGLAAENYCHFTAPIRRYPDLQIHRIIKEILAGRLTEKRIERLKKIVYEAAEQSSQRERVAMEAERETDDLKKTEYMTYHLGEEFDGIISSVVSFGMFVELENTIEGLVRISTLIDDYYIYDEENYLFRGERTKKTYKIGDIVRVKLVRADIPQREIDFILVE